MQSAIRDNIDVAEHPVLAREVCEQMMRALLQEDQLARYVARNRIELLPLAGDVPAHVAQEIQRLEPVSRCRLGNMLMANRSCHLDPGKPRCGQRKLGRTADSHRTGRDSFYASECLVKPTDPHCRLVLIPLGYFLVPNHFPLKFSSHRRTADQGAHDVEIFGKLGPGTGSGRYSGDL